jgi:DNA repair exonuclease SbcCD nuclease subunit
VPSIEPFRFLHTGDLHLDSPFGGLTAEVPADVRELLRGSSTAAWRNVVATALDEQVDFVVIAGDVFEGRSPTLLGQTRFRDGLAQLDAAGIASFVVHGNHDPMDGRSWAPSLDFPASTTRFGTRRVESAPALREGREIARVYGQSYRHASVTENLAANFRREANVPFAIGLLHANVGDVPGHGNYAPCSIEDLRASGMDYWALGHIHKPGRVTDAPLAIYCGIPQGRDPGETGPRGAWLVEVDAAARPTARFVACDVARWQHLAVSIDGLETDEHLLRALREGLAGVAADADGRSLVVRLRLEGRGPLHASLRRLGYLADLRRLLNEERSSAPPWAWLESVSDATQPAVDIATRRGAPDFVGDFLRVAASARRASRTTDPQEHERWSAALSEAIGPLFDEAPRGRKYLAEARPGPDELLGTLIDEAELLGLDLLLAAEEERS